MKTVRNLLRKIIQDVCFLFKYNEIYFIKESYEEMFWLVIRYMVWINSDAIHYFLQKKSIKKRYFVEKLLVLKN